MPLEDSIAQYQAAAEDLRELLRVAHETIRDLRTEKRELKEIREKWLSSADMEAKLDEIAADGLKKFMSEFDKSIDKTTDAVYRRFDTIMMICMGDDPESVRKGKHTTIELLQGFITQKAIPAHLTIEVHLMMNEKTRQKEHDRHNGEVNRRTGHGFDELPILIDHRVPDDIAILYLPDYDGPDKPGLFEFHTLTQQGLKEAVDAINELSRRRSAAIPAAFKKSAKPKRGPKPA